MPVEETVREHVRHFDRQASIRRAPSRGESGPARIAALRGLPACVTPPRVMTVWVDSSLYRPGLSPRRIGNRANWIQHSDGRVDHQERGRLAWASKNALLSTSGPVSRPSAFHVKPVVVATPFEGGTQTTPPLLVRSQPLMTSQLNGRALRGEIGSTESLRRGTNRSWCMSNWRIGARGPVSGETKRTAQAGPGFSFVVRTDARETGLAPAAGATRRAMTSRRQSSDGQARWLVAVFHVKLVARNLRSSSHRSPAVESLRESVHWRYSGAALMRAARTQPCCDGAVVLPMPSEGPSVCEPMEDEHWNV